MGTIAIILKADGTIACNWEDKVDLEDLMTNMIVKRASSIEFDNEKKLWQVRIPDTEDGEILYAHKKRSKCLEWEHDYVVNNLTKILKSNISGVT